MTGGGWRCPYCDHTDVLRSFVLAHIRAAHPDKPQETKP